MKTMNEGGIVRTEDTGAIIEQPEVDGKEKAMVLVPRSELQEILRQLEQLKSLAERPSSAARQ